MDFILLTPKFSILYLTVNTSQSITTFEKLIEVQSFYLFSAFRNLK